MFLQRTRKIKRAFPMLYFSAVLLTLEISRKIRQLSCMTDQCVVIE
jgi:hypothetical protein